MSMDMLLKTRGGVETVFNASNLNMAAYCEYVVGACDGEIENLKREIRTQQSFLARQKFPEYVQGEITPIVDEGYVKWLESVVDDLKQQLNNAKDAQDAWMEVAEGGHALFTCLVHGAMLAPNDPKFDGYRYQIVQSLTDCLLYHGSVQAYIA